MELIVTVVKTIVFCIGAFFTIVLLGDRRDEVLSAVKRKSSRRSKSHNCTCSY